jgi:D-psicose/D-tagatose/L-ribulose 3-epimerase
MRRLSVSSIVWPNDAMDEALDLLVRLGVSGVEVAPGQILSGWSAAAPAEAAAFRTRAAERGLAVSAMQALLFNVAGCHVFEADATRQALLDHLARVAEVAGVLGVAACVYGAPKTRDPGDLPTEAAWEIAVDLFRRAADLFEAAGTCLTFEANPETYGCRFVTHTDQGVAFVQAVDRPGLRLQLDTGTILINGEDPHDAIAGAAAVMGHFHVSEPDLAPVGSLASPHEALGRACRAIGYDGWVSVEMRATPNWRADVTRAVALAKDLYL